MNKCLDVYKDREDIFSVSGYNYPVKIPVSYPHELYKWMGHSAWGFGIWKEKWEKIDWNYESVQTNVKKFLKHYKEVFKLNSIDDQYIPTLMGIVEKGKLYGDGYICLHQFINNMYSVFPIISRVKNMGHDGSGSNCGYIQNDIYREQEIYTGTGIYGLPNELKTDDEIDQILRKYFKNGTKTKIKTFAKLFLMNAGFYNATK